MSQLVVDRVAKEYPTRSGPLVVLHDVSFGLDSGESLAIVGPSGTGKSTLLYLVGTLDRPTSGSITLDGVDARSLSESELADFRRAHIGFVFQDHFLLPQLSALENVVVPWLAAGSVGTNELRKGAELLERIGLANRQHHLPSELSGGERQRVALARALIRRPTLLLADEPTGNLDSDTAESVGDLLVEMQAEVGVMLIVVTHNLELARRFTRTRTLAGGRLM